MLDGKLYGLKLSSILFSEANTLATPHNENTTVNANNDDTNFFNIFFIINLLFSQYIRKFYQTKHAQPPFLYL